MSEIQSRTRPTTATRTPSTVVVGVDGSDGAISAVRWAARHARATGARLRLIHAVRESAGATVPLPPPASFAGAAPRRRRRARPAKRVVALAAAEARLFAPAVEVSGYIQPGGTVDVLVHASAGASLLVVGARASAAPSATPDGPIGVRVAAQAHCPTALIPGDGDADGPVVVAVDGPQAAQPALRFAFAEAARRRTGLVAVHTWTPPVGAAPGTAAGPDHTALGRAAGRLVTAVVAPWRSAFPGVEVVELVLGSGPEAALPQSTAGAVLAVVGARGPARRLGSTGRAMLAGARCPVIVAGETPSPG